MTPPVPTVTLAAPVLSPGNVAHPQFSVTDSEAGVSFVCSVTGPTSVPASAISCGPTTTVDLSGPGRQVIQNRVELGWEARVVRHKHP